MLTFEHNDLLSQRCWQRRRGLKQLLHAPWQEFLLSPLQLGVPYSRPRYYALAAMRSPDGSCPFPAPALPNGQPFCRPAASLLPAQHADRGDSDSEAASAAYRHVQVAPIRKFLVKQPAPGDGVPALLPGAEPSRSNFDCSASHPAAADGAATTMLACTGLPAAAVASCSKGSTHGQTAEEGGLGSCGGRDGGSEAGCSGQGEGFHWVPDAVIQQWGEVLDIVQPLSQRCNCFTKTYSSYIKA